MREVAARWGREKGREYAGGAGVAGPLVGVSVRRTLPDDLGGDLVFHAHEMSFF